MTVTAALIAAKTIMKIKFLARMSASRELMMRCSPSTRSGKSSGRRTIILADTPPLASGGKEFFENMYFLGHLRSNDGKLTHMTHVLVQ